MDKANVIRAARIAATANASDCTLYSAAGTRAQRCVKTWYCETAQKWRTQRYEYRAGNWQVTAGRLDSVSLAQAEETHFAEVELMRLGEAVELGRTLAHRNKVAVYVYRQASGLYSWQYVTPGPRMGKLVAAFDSAGNAKPIS